jgi:hypothetical protein
MYVVVRSYSGPGASELFDLLGQREQDVRVTLTALPHLGPSRALSRSNSGSNALRYEEAEHALLEDAR